MIWKTRAGSLRTGCIVGRRTALLAILSTEISNLREGRQNALRRPREGSQRASESRERASGRHQQGPRTSSDAREEPSEGSKRPPEGYRTSQRVDRGLHGAFESQQKASERLQKAPKGRWKRHHATPEPLRQYSAPLCASRSVSDVRRFLRTGTSSVLSDRSCRIGTRLVTSSCLGQECVFGSQMATPLREECEVAQ